MSELTPIEKVTAEALEQLRAGTLPTLPPEVVALFDEIARRNPDLVAETDAIIRRVIEKTTH